MNTNGQFIDLHMHSYWSFDGFASPKELMERAYSMGLNTIAITEHDNTDSWKEILSVHYLYRPLRITSGIELTSKFEDSTIGVLGIGFNPTDSKLTSFLQATSLEDLRFLDRWYKAAFELGLGSIRRIVDEWLSENFPDFPQRRNRNIPEWILARLIWKSGFVPDIETAQKMNTQIVNIARHPPIPSIEIVINLIHDAGGLALLEHPPEDISVKTVVTMMEIGFDGIELYHIGVDPLLRESILSISDQKNWLISAGSDFHGVRNNWGRHGDVLPHPIRIHERMHDAISKTALGLLI